MDFDISATPEMACRKRAVDWNIRSHCRNSHTGRRARLHPAALATWTPLAKAAP
jgi:hypothetical protein